MRVNLVAVFISSTIQRLRRSVDSDSYEFALTLSLACLAFSVAVLAWVVAR